MSCIYIYIYTYIENETHTLYTYHVVQVPLSARKPVNFCSHRAPPPGSAGRGGEDERRRLTSLPRILWW